MLNLMEANRRRRKTRKVLEKLVPAEFNAYWKARTKFFDILAFWLSLAVLAMAGAYWPLNSLLN